MKSSQSLIIIQTYKSKGDSCSYEIFATDLEALEILEMETNSVRRNNIRK